MLTSINVLLDIQCAEIDNALNQMEVKQKEPSMEQTRSNETEHSKLKKTFLYHSSAFKQHLESMVARITLCEQSIFDSFDQIGCFLFVHLLID